MLQTAVNRKPRAAEGIPECYGVSFSGESRKCGVCPVRDACVTQCQRWLLRASLSERLKVLEKSMVISSETLNLPQLYTRLYEQHYGTRDCPDLVTGAAAFGAFGWVDRFCRENDIDPALWITAQMHGMKMFLDKQRESGGHCPYFRINMLCGDKAKVRYNVYLRIAYRRFRHVGVDVFNGRTDLTKLCVELKEDEERIGAFYCMNVVEGHPVSWRECVNVCEAGELWRAVHEVPGIASMKKLTELRQTYDMETIKRLKTLATLRAAVAVASRYAYDLADRIGYRDPFLWNDFAMLLLRLYGGEKITPVNKVKGIAGTEWRGA